MEDDAREHLRSVIVMLPQEYISDELTHFVGRALPIPEAKFKLLIRHQV